MTKKGWWRQLQSDDYPETQLSYGQDMQALKGESNRNMPTVPLIPSIREPAKPIYDKEKKKQRTALKYRRYPSIYCTQCSHKATITDAFVQSISPNEKGDAGRLVQSLIRKRRLKCGKCGSKKVAMVKRIPSPNYIS